MMRKILEFDYALENGKHIRVHKRDSMHHKYLIITPEDSKLLLSEAQFKEWVRGLNELLENN